MHGRLDGQFQHDRDEGAPMASVAMMHGHDGMMDGWMGGWMLLWLLVGIALLGLVIAATVWLIRNMKNSPSASSDARNELDMRYARGDITSEEYDDRVNRIGKR
jgi:putative membrane protein